MKIRNILYGGLLLLLTACSEDIDQTTPTEVRYDLIGRAINFNASMADPFVTRSYQRHNGVFNEDDRMIIYRQYSDDGGHTFDPESESYRIYWLHSKQATGTSISLNEEWLPKAGEKGWNPKTGKWAEDYPSDRRGEFTQEDDDSLTWDNGKTVRFRAWSRSNLNNSIARSASTSSSSEDVRTSARNQYYPDFCISDWVTVSGPTEQVPLTLKHQGCRIGFIPRSGNELVKAEICIEKVEDYRWADNSTDLGHDNASSEHGKSLTQAQAELSAVQAVYNQMCMPAGVDLEHSVLTAMSNDRWNNKATDLSEIKLLTEADGAVKIGTKTPGEITSGVKRPQFSTNFDGRLYMVTIPYDMSSDEHKGEALKLPACTRFRIYLRDTNNGDAANTSGYEGQYHIFSLADVKDRSGNYLFTDGMELRPGYSYTFSVGYHYDHFDITPADDFRWTEDTPENGVRTDEANPIATTRSYQWWKDAIKKAIPTGLEEFEPVFKISSEEEFLEFISLVNGTAPLRTDGLTQMPRPEKTYDKDHLVLKSDYRWYRSTDIDAKGRIVSGADSVTHAVAEAEGYIFYEHYHPANGDQAAYSREDYLRGAYSFYDQSLNRHFPVYLTADLDFRDQRIDPVGKLTTTPFRGIFDGYDEEKGKIHTIKNIYVDGGYMFKYCNDVAIRNLWIETTHDFMLLDQSSAMKSSGYGAYIVGVSIKAPSSGNPLARSILGSSYVTGCIYQGRAGGALIGEADNLSMYGCMMAASGLASGSGALLGSYATGSTPFFTPQTAEKLTWGRFMGNYYDKTLSPGTTAVGGVTDDYRPQEYIRGSESWILKAKNDNMISGEIPYEKLENRLKIGYYGLAPWKAMNYAIYEYNLVGEELIRQGGIPMNCKMHYVNDGTGFANVYPWMKYGEPNSTFDETGYRGNYTSLNLLEQLN